MDVNPGAEARAGAGSTAKTENPEAGARLETGIGGSAGGGMSIWEGPEAAVV